MVVLLLIQITTTIGLYMIEDSILLTKIAQSELKKDDLFINGEKFLNQLESIGMTDDGQCRLPTMTYDEMSEKPLIWWKALACFEIQDEYQYYYFIEPLAQKNDKNKADFFRAILLVLHKNNGMKEILQNTFNRRDNTNEISLEHRI